jgi:hypothetical protein
MIGYQDKINQILRGAETIKKNHTSDQHLIEALKTIAKAADVDIITVINALEYGNAIDPDTGDKWTNLLDTSF